MTAVEQLALDLWGEAAQAAAWLARHQVGQIRMPYATNGHRVGDLIPAWRCCACGGVEPSEFLLDLSHGCCGRKWLPRCQNPPGRPPHPWDFRDHWIPPTDWTDR